MPLSLRIEHKEEVLNVPETADREFIAKLFGVPRDELIGLQVGDIVIPLADGKPLRPEELGLIAARQATCRLARRPGIDWTTPRKLDLSGGTGGRGGEYVYIPRPGITVSSSAPSCPQNDWYFIEYLFKGPSTGRQHSEFWLTQSEGPQTLMIAFERPVNVAMVRVCATTYSAGPACTCRSNYRVAVTSVNGGPRLMNESFVSTTNDAFGSFHTHVVREENVIEVMFELTQEGLYGVSLKKIEIWVVD
jgi:hypothetical protein